MARSPKSDREAGTAVECLRAVGVPSIFLQGGAIATWLYQDGETRPYGDVDPLVSPGQLTAAIEALGELGYVHELESAHPAEFGPKELELLGPEKVCVDLHHGLIGVSLPSQPSQYCRDVLVDRTTAFQLTRNVQVQVLDPDVRGMHLALHAALNGPIDVKALADLERGLTKVSREECEEGGQLAEQLEATEAFAAGLRLMPAGTSQADELALPRRMTVELALRPRSAPQDAPLFERLVQVPGAWGKACVFARKVFPTAALLHANSPVARRGRLGLLLVRLGHRLAQGGNLGPALVAWFWARRAAPRSQLARQTRTVDG